jgi:hypothetical protein
VQCHNNLIGTFYASQRDLFCFFCGRGLWHQLQCLWPTIRYKGTVQQKLTGVKSGINGFPIVPQDFFFILKGLGPLHYKYLFQRLNTLYCGLVGKCGGHN